MPSRTQRQGNISASAIATRFLECGFDVWLPLGDGTKADLIVERNGRLWRVQCKTGRLRNGAVVFGAWTTVQRTALKPAHQRRYGAEIDLFAVYCPSTRQTFVIPRLGFGISYGTLRLVAARNNQRAGIRMANRFELTPEHVEEAQWFSQPA